MARPAQRCKTGDVVLFFSVKIQNKKRMKYSYQLRWTHRPLAVSQTSLNCHMMDDSISVVCSDGEPPPWMRDQVCARVADSINTVTNVSKPYL